ncbi:MAG TPA: hypothetical protein PLW31_14255 [Bacteroidales bacterium]|nr:hypothetical protein [Bacteroidales bacterium]HOX79189.1 hypothetical protein [Bacteroidales bacterium]HPI86854.1 hypothetical protein [Bacteroidales bacterium]
MKNQSEKSIRKIVAVMVTAMILFLGLPDLVQAQSLREVIKGYKGWAGNPDSLKVHIDNSFSDAEKADIRAAMKRWNDAGCKPAFKEVASPPADVKIKEGDPGEGNAGIYEWETDGDGKVTGGTITIRNNPDPSLKETATHELGHALGLDDCDAAKNPSDVMKGTGPGNGTDGGLSKHDSTELKAAIASITVPAPPPAGEKPLKKRAIAPTMAIQPGQGGILQFDLEMLFPPLSEAFVTPTGDDLVQVLNYNLNGNMLMVEVFILPSHGSGKFYLDIEVHPPLPELPVFFLGEHFVNSTPVGPLTFQCPFMVYVVDGRVHVDWTDFHTYPNPTQQLRAHLTVDGNRHFHARGSGDLVIDLPPGMHTFELELDDYQINSAVFTEVFEVVQQPHNIPLADWAIFLAGLLITVALIYRLYRR